VSGLVRCHRARLQGCSDLLLDPAKRENVSSLAVPFPPSDGHTYVCECPDCGLFQGLPELQPGMLAACLRCNGTLRRARNNSASLACTVAAALLFVLALELPFLELRAVGRHLVGTLFTGPATLQRQGFWHVAVLVVAFLVICPALRISLLLMAFVGSRLARRPRWLLWLFGCFERIAPWAMVEVFLLGVFVAFTRLRALALVEIGPSLVALGALLLALVAADAALDRYALWEKLSPAPRETPLEDPSERIACHGCGLVTHAAEGEPCPRCRHALHRRKPRSVQRAWALSVAATVLYIPANVYPVMSVTRMGKGGPSTIVNGVFELARANLWPLAIIVFLASVVVPVLKLGGLVALLLATHRRSRAHLLLRTRAFRFIAVIGRWSMIDIFALSTLVGMVQLGFFATVIPGDGAIAFASVVVLTMLATELFDPRLMWDGAEEGGASRRLSGAVE
jgi:paraquat-inducible protein A